MFPFKKKKEKEEEFDDEDELSPEDDLQDRKLTRKFKDLNSENKKKRKEPPKPWGKRERLTVLIIMTITVLLSGILFLSSNNNFHFSNFQFPMNFHFSNFHFSSLNIFKEEIIEIRKK